MRHVLVLGATSYVGSFLVARLGAAGYQVTAVGRSDAVARVALGSFPSWLEFRTIEELRRGSTRTCDSVVNLAYIKHAAPHLAYRSSAVLMRAVHETVNLVKARHLVHASTIAVFGNPPTKVATQLPRGRGYDQYSEAKILSERLLVRLARSSGYQLSIVRFGNVIGPASPLWVAGLAQRLIAALPLGWTTGFGPSNATHVSNIADYVARLIEASDHDLRDAGMFHHLTELAGRSWEELVSVMEEVTGVGRVLISDDSPMMRGGGLVRHLRSIVRGPSGAAVRSLTGWLPLTDTLSRQLTHAVKGRDSPWAHLQGAQIDPADRGLYDLLSRSVPIPQVTIRGWVPPIAFDEALTEIREWLAASGFALNS